MKTSKRRRLIIPSKPHIYFEHGYWHLIRAARRPFGVSDDWRIAVNYKAHARVSQLNALGVGR